MVLVHHSPTSLGGRLRAGWSGVDLFFVLSGFLVSGLLFREYLAAGRIRPWRFYVRRGFKIYPNFYVMLIVTALLQTVLGPPLVPRLVLHDATFVQNYLGPWWQHTWSLAVEEHFYLLLPPVLLLLVGSDRFREAPVRWSAVLMAALGLALLAWRSSIVIRGGTSDAVLFKTHLRLDSLAFGVLISVLWHFAPQRIVFVRRYRLALLIAGLLLTLPAYVLPYEHPFILTIGLTMLYVGYGMVLAAVLTSTRRLAGPATPLFAFIGFYSYSIYLWHLPVLYVLRWLRLPPASAGIYFAGSLVVGVLVAKAVEIPTLRLRDRWFPATEMAPAVGKESRPHPGRGRRLFRATTLALVAAGGGHLLLVAAARHVGVDPDRNRTWVRSDSHCDVLEAARGAREGPDPSGCFPGYPAIVRLLSGASGLRPVPAGRVVSAVATVGALFILALALPQAGPAQRTLVVLLAGVAPGFLWWHTTLPISSLACLSLAAVALANRGHFLAGGACGAAAAFTHPAGVLVLLPLALVAASARGRERAGPLLAACGLPLAGLAAAVAFLRWSTGSWTSWSTALALGEPSTWAADPAWRQMLALHLVLTTGLVALAAVLWFRYRLSMPPMEAALVAHGTIIWIFAMWTSPALRLQIQAVALAGLLPLLARLHPAVAGTLVGASVALGWFASLLFFGGPR